MEKKTKKLYKTFKCLLGVNERYFHSNEVSKLDQISLEIQTLAESNYLNTPNNYISLVISPAKCIYRESWGCPVGGEVVYELTGNNLFDDIDIDLWEDNVNKFLLELKEFYKQNTLQIEWNVVEITRYETEK